MTSEEFEDNLDMLSDVLVGKMVRLADMTEDVLNNPDIEEGRRQAEIIKSHKRVIEDLYYALTY